MTDFLLDLQPGLAQVIAATSGGNTTRYVHASRGIHAQEDPSGNWTYPLQDGLGSVRGEVTDALAVQAQHHYAPYGERSGGSIAGGFDPTPFGFTGEQTDANDLLYLRARHYAPGLGVFTALDPVEGGMGSPMTLNGYAYVGGSPINRTDASGMFWEQFAQQQQRRLNTYVNTQTQRLQQHIYRAMQWLGWVNQLNNCGFGLPSKGSGLFSTVRDNFQKPSANNSAYKIPTTQSQVPKGDGFPTLPSTPEACKEYCEQNGNPTFGDGSYSPSCVTDCLNGETDPLGFGSLCDVLGLLSFKTIGVAFSLTGYLGVGGGGTLYFMTDCTGRWVAFGEGEFGGGFAAGAAVGQVVASGASLDDFAGFGITGGVSVAIVSVNVSIPSDLSSPTGDIGLEPHGGLQLSLGGSVRLTQSFPIWDSHNPNAFSDYIAQNIDINIDNVVSEIDVWDQIFGGEGQYQEDIEQLSGGGTSGSPINCGNGEVLIGNIVCVPWPFTP